MHSLVLLTPDLRGYVENLSIFTLKISVEFLANYIAYRLFSHSKNSYCN